MVRTHIPHRVCVYLVERQSVCNDAFIHKGDRVGLMSKDKVAEGLTMYMLSMRITQRILVP